MTGLSTDIRGTPADEYREILKKSYLFLRFGLVGTVAAMLLAVWFTPAGYLLDGEGTLESISHYYYTPARTVFTAALCAAALALVAIAGRGIQSHLLDLAALLAPLIAIIPTPTLPSEVGPDAQLAACPGDVDCIPGTEFASVATGFQVWLWMSIFVMAAVAIRMLYDRFVKARHVPSAMWVVLVLGLGVWVAYFWLWNIPEQEMLRRFGHVFAASTFFVLIAIVALIEAWRQWVDRNDPTPPPPPAFLPRRAFAVIYAVLGIGMFVNIVVATLILFDVIRPEEWGVDNAVFIVEVTGLLAFACFWLVQTAEHAKDSDGWEPSKAHQRRTAARAKA